MNGEMLIIANTFLFRLTKLGYIISKIRVKNIPESEGYTARRNFANYPEFFATYKEEITALKPTNYIGDFLFIESMNITYSRLGYSNLFRCYDIIGKRRIVQTIGVTRNTQSNTSSLEKIYADASKIRDVSRTINNLNGEFDTYKSESFAKYNELI